MSAESAVTGEAAEPAGEQADEDRAAEDRADEPTPAPIPEAAPIPAPIPAPEPVAAPVHVSAPVAPGHGPTAPWPPRPQQPAHPWVQPPPPRAKPRIARRELAAAGVVLAAGIALAAVGLVGASRPAAKPAAVPAAQLQDERARAAWRTTPIDTLFPPALDRPGGEKYVRLGVAGPAGCEVLPKDFVAELAKDAPGTTCDRVLRATYADTTQTVVATVGIVVVGGTADQRDKVWRGWTPDSDARKPELMPGVYAVPGSVAAKFTDAQRIVWNSETSDDGSFLVYGVAGFLDGRPGSSPEDLRSGVTKTLAGDSPPVQASLDLPTQIVGLLAAAEKKA